MQSTINFILQSFSEILPVFLIAVLCSSLLDYFLPDSIFKNFSKLSFFNLVFVSVTGALIPMCTCGMIPFAQKLYRRSVHWVLILGFLVSGSACSIPALILTMILGSKFVVARFLASIGFGISVALIAFFSLSKPATYSIQIPEFKPSCCEAHKKWFEVVWHDVVEMSKTFLPWIFVASCIAGLLHNYSSTLALDSSLGKIILPFLASVIAFPFYFCAGADIPLTQAFVNLDLGFGTLISFMLAAPTLNLTSFLIYKKLIGLRDSFYLFLLMFAVSSILGILLNYL